MTRTMQSDEDGIITRKMVLLGDQGVGKTSLIVRYVDKKYDRFVSPTIGASYFSSKIKVQDLIVHLQIWDTAGQERFKALAPMFYRNANGAFLVYDITRPESFENIKNWVKELQRTSEKSIVLCVVGCKLDRSNERQVSTDQGIDYANSIGASYHECSSLKDEGIDPIFQTAASEFVKLSTINTHRNTVTLNKNNVQHGNTTKSNCC